MRTYRDYLQARGLSPTSVSAQLSTVRGRYRGLLRDNASGAGCPPYPTTGGIGFVSPDMLNVTPGIHARGAKPSKAGRPPAQRYRTALLQEQAQRAPLSRLPLPQHFYTSAPYSGSRRLQSGANPQRRP
jgi:hypothetical protein